jgi:peptidoglycan-associated lipoprotein
MQLRMKKAFALLMIIAAASAATAMSQTAAKADKPFRGELALDYSYLRSNAPPGGCGCFSLNGGGGAFAWQFNSLPVAVVADADVMHTGSIAGTGTSLTLSTFTAGGRYRPRLEHLPLQPYGQVLVGLAHANATLAQGANSSVSKTGSAFASNLGGGLDLRASRRFSIRLIEADYLVTTFNNNVNNHQNNLRISAGLVIKFARE